DASGSVDVAALTAHFGLNHNAIRQHLAKLLDAGLVAERTERRGGPGRPRLVYQLAPGVESRWGAIGPYERLSLLLAEAVRTGDPPVEVGRRAGKALVAAGTSPGDAVGAMAATMERLGFEPSVRRRGQQTEIVLGACPFASAAVAAPDVVCALHLGVAQAVADDTDTTVAELVARDPRRAKCRLRLA